MRQRAQAWRPTKPPVTTPSWSAVTYPLPGVRPGDPVDRRTPGPGSNSATSCSLRLEPGRPSGSKRRDGRQGYERPASPKTRIRTTPQHPMRSVAAPCREEGAAVVTPSNPFGDPGEQGETEDNKSFQELRTHAESLEKQLKAAQKENGVLSEFKAGSDAAAKVAAAEAAGLTKGQASRFVKEHDGEITEEAVTAWKVELGIAEAPPAPPAEGAATPEATTQSTGFAPTSVGGTPANAARLSHDDYKALLGTNFEEAARAVAEGRVDGIYTNPEVQ